MGWGGFSLAWGENIPVPAAYQVADGPSVGELFSDPYAEFEFVLEGHVYRHEQSIGWPDAWGSFGPWGYGGSESQQDSLLRYAWRGMVTDSTDIPSHTYIPSILINPLNFEISIPWSGSMGQASSGFGTLEFASVIDNDLAYWAGRQFSLKVGGRYNIGLDTEVSLPYSKYVMRYRFIVDDIEYDEEIARLLIKDGLKELDAPIQQSTYGGTGTYDGNDAVKGQYKPCVYGDCFNIPCTLIDDTNYIYQINDGAQLSDITDIRVNGKSWTDGGDTTDLYAWGGGASTYKTDLSRGLFRMGAQPDGLVTADAARTTTQGGLVLLEMMEDMGITNIDYGSFRTYLKEDIGFYCGTSAQNGLSTINTIVSSADCYIYVSRVGLITLGGHANPRAAIPGTEIFGWLDKGKDQFEILTNKVLNNSDILDSSWLSWRTPVVTTGIADPLGFNNAFNISSDAPGTVEGKYYDNVIFENDGPAIFAGWIRYVDVKRVRINLLNAAPETHDYQVQVDWQATPPESGPPTISKASGKTIIFETPVDSGNGWWFVQWRYEIVSGGGPVYGLWLDIYPQVPSGTGGMDFAYPCLFVSKDSPNFPYSFPIANPGKTVNVTTGAATNETEGNEYVGRDAHTYPAWIVAIRRLATPYAPKTIKVAYKKNWSPQNEDSLDTSLSQAVKNSYAAEHLVTEIVNNDDALIINPEAHDLFMEGGFLVAEIDGNAVRDGIALRVGAKRDLFQVEIVAPLFQITIGEIVKIYHDRFQLSEGKNGEVLRIVESATTTTLDLLVVEDL